MIITVLISNLGFLYLAKVLWLEQLKEETSNSECQFTTKCYTHFSCVFS